MESHHQREHMEKEAVRQGTTPEKVAKHAQQGTQPDAHVREQAEVDVPGQMPRETLQDGYRINQGATYDQRGPGQEAEEDYDPTHSGVRHAANHPGKRVNNPGREEGTAWGEQLQMGRTTDTPQRQNPAD